MEAEEHREYGDHATSEAGGSSNPGRKSWYFPFPKCSDQVWGPPTLQFNGYWVCLPGLKRPGLKANHSLPSIGEKKNEVYFPYTPSWRRQGKFYLYFTVNVNCNNLENCLVLCSSDVTCTSAKIYLKVRKYTHCVTFVALSLYYWL